MGRNFHINGIMAIAVGSLTLIAIYLATVGPAFSATVIPHRAFYEMQLGKTDRNSNVQAVTGRSAFTLGRDCSGWQSNEDYVIEFGEKREKQIVLYRVLNLGSLMPVTCIVLRSVSKAIFNQKKTLLAMPA